MRTTKGNRNTRAAQSGWGPHNLEFTWRSLSKHHIGNLGNFAISGSTEAKREFDESVAVAEVYRMDSAHRGCLGSWVLSPVGVQLTRGQWVGSVGPAHVREPGSLGRSSVCHCQLSALGQACYKPVPQFPCKLGEILAAISAISEQTLSEDQSPWHLTGHQVRLGSECRAQAHNTEEGCAE